MRSLTAALTWAFIAGLLLLPLSQMPQLSGSAPVLLIAAGTLCACAGSGLALLKAGPRR